MKINLIYKGFGLVSDFCPRGPCAAATGHTRPPRLSLGTNCECEFYESLSRGRAHFQASDCPCLGFSFYFELFILQNVGKISVR